jgi:hypothetical protein
MSTPAKLKGNTHSQVTKLKVLWRDSLTPDERDFWRSLFISADSTQAQTRSLMATKLGIKLQRDSQLNDFRKWELEQQELELEAERQADEERREIEAHPHWTLDQVREAMLKKAYRRASARGDFKLGLATVKQDLSAQAVQLDREKLELLKKKAAQAEQTERVVRDAELTPEERAQRIKEIYGRA